MGNTAFRYSVNVIKVKRKSVDLKASTYVCEQAKAMSRFMLSN